MDKDKWPHHKAQVKFRSDMYSLYEKYGVHVDDVHKFGLLSYIIRAFRIKEIYDEMVDAGQFRFLEKIDSTKPYIWLGGCGPDRCGTLDFHLYLPSNNFKENKHFEEVIIKTVPSSQNPDIYKLREDEVGKRAVNGSKSKGYHTEIERFTPDKYTIAGELILGERSADWCNTKANEPGEEFYRGLRVCSDYKNKRGLPLQVFGEIPNELMELYEKCLKGMNKGHLHSADREAVLLHRAAIIKFEKNLLDNEQLDSLIPILEENKPYMQRLQATTIA